MGLRFAHTSVVAAAILAFAAPTAFLDAQTDPDIGTLFGVVVDPLGVGVPDQTLQVDEIAKADRPARPGNRHMATTDNGGYFELRDLPIGTYIILGSGWPLRPVEVTIKAGERIERDLKVEVGSVHMSATVCGECVSPMMGLDFVARSMDEEHYRGEPVLPALFRQPEQFAITYPAALRAAGIEGTVEIEGSVGTNGLPTRLEVTSDTHPELNDAVMTVLKNSSWTPARVRGIPVEGPIAVQIDFVLRVQVTSP